MSALFAAGVVIGIFAITALLFLGVWAATTFLPLVWALVVIFGTLAVLLFLLFWLAIR